MRPLAVLTSYLVLLGSWNLGCRVSETRAMSGLAGMAEPSYTDEGDLLLPDGYREWVFVGASLGLRYAEDGEPADDEEGTFHNVYVQPQAYRYFLEHGEFPEKTMLPMETYSPGTREPKSELTGGIFEDEWIGLSAAVKDSDRFGEGWGYVTFWRDGGPRKDTAKPFPKQRCYDCHAEHGANDNVFTQFYPVLNQ